MGSDLRKRCASGRLSPRTTSPCPSALVKGDAVPVEDHEVVDSNGRVYRVGIPAEQILGRSRKWMLWMPWLAMFGVSVFEYGYGAAEKTLEKVHGWTLSQAFWLVAVWTVFQAAVAFPAGRLREKGIVSARVAMLTAAVMVAAAFVTIALTGDLLLNFLFYSVVG